MTEYLALKEVAATMIHSNQTASTDAIVVDGTTAHAVTIVTASATTKQ